MSLKAPRPTTSVIALPRPPASLRWVAPLLIAGGIALIAVDTMHPAMMQGLRTKIVDATAPVLTALGQPVQTMNRAVEWGRGLVALHDENRRLALENQRLKQWYLAAQQLELENRNLRDLVGIESTPIQPVISARVVADTGGYFARSVLVDRGMRDGLFKGQVAMTAAGVAGRVQDVGEHSARLLLVTDINSRVPAVIERTGDRVLVAGDNRDHMRLDYVPPESEIVPGDRVLTSGAGGVFPAGLPLGMVANIQVGQGSVRHEIRIQPAVNIKRMALVSLLDPVAVAVPENAAGQDADINIPRSTPAMTDATPDMSAGIGADDSDRLDAVSDGHAAPTPLPVRKPSASGSDAVGQMVPSAPKAVGHHE